MASSRRPATRRRCRGGPCPRPGRRGGRRRCSAGRDAEGRQIDEAGEHVGLVAGEDPPGERVVVEAGVASPPGRPGSGRARVFGHRGRGPSSTSSVASLSTAAEEQRLLVVEVGVGRGLGEPAARAISDTEVGPVALVAEALDRQLAAAAAGFARPLVAWPSAARSGDGREPSTQP